ncbi:MAG: hypothetical protein IKZ04_03170, partial [Spirochaetaceae bacterium]|nr:hypothetical protein [Spirochaetaceae bacterium]
MTFRKFPYYCVLLIVTLSTLFLSCNNILLEKKDADFSVKISMPPVYSTTTSSDPVTGGDISTESPAEKWNLIAWVEEAGTKKQLGYEEKKAVDGTVAIYFENIPIGKYIHVFVEVYSATGDLCYKGSSEGKEPHLVEDTNKKISISLDKYYKVIFYNGNEIVETKYIKLGETAGKPKDLTGENPFKGWSTQEPSPEYTQEIYDFNEPITRNLSLYAVWGEKGSNEPGNPGDSEGETGGSGNTGNTEEEFNFKCNYIFKIGDSDDFPDSVENASYENGVITVNYPDRSGSVWDYYARAIQDKDGEAIFGEGNYKISLDMKAEKPTVVGIQAAYADMFFTVGTEWATYEFETGYIDVVPSNDAGYGKNGITIGSALTEKLYFNNV